MKILFISISAPPQNSPESLQVAKFIKGLSKQHSITLVTIKEAVGWRRPDKRLYEYLANVYQVIRLNHYTSRLARYFFKVFFSTRLKRPDEYFLFQRESRIVASKSKEKPDLIYSRATPFSSCLLALKLKEVYKVPWVMHLSDLWADSPHFKFTNQDMLYQQKVEGDCFKLADRISFTSLETIEFYTKKYPQYADKFIFTPNVFDDKELDPNPFRFDEKLKFLHAGNFYGEGRNPLILISAFRSIYKSTPQLLANVEVHFMGRFNKDIQDILVGNNLPFIKITEEYQFEDSVTEQRNSHIMLLFDWKFKHMKSVFFLSKVLGYMASRRLILAVTEKGSTCYNVIEGKYGSCFEHNDTEGVREFILKILLNYKDGNLDFFTPADPDLKYSASNNVLRLSNVFENLIKTEI